MNETNLLTLPDIVNLPPPQPWAEGDKIPWNEPAFSERMLREHLSQAHDAASRRATIIAKQVDWIHNHLLGGQPTAILDMGCGPGLYTSRLAALGHTCTGIDFSPASIAYAHQPAQPGCRYLEGDLREVEYGSGYGLAMLIFGEFNTFHPAQVRLILHKAQAALAPQGLLLLEAHTFAEIQRIGQRPASWYASPQGLWSASPHLCLQQSSWDADRAVATNRHLVIEAASGRVSRYGESLQAYTEPVYEALLRECGFGQVSFYPALTGVEDDRSDAFVVITGRKEQALSSPG